MGRPRVTKGLPTYVTAFPDKNGKIRYRFRRVGHKPAYINAEPGTDEFWQSYLALKNGKPTPVGESLIVPGTFNDLIARYYRSTVWHNIPSERTKTVYRGEFERFRSKYGDRRVATMTAKHVSNLIAAMSDRPGAAGNLLKRLRQLFDFAILMGMRKDNPGKVAKAPRSKSEGFHTWSEAEIESFEAAHPIGTRERLALSLLLYTAQRRSDVVRMGPQHVKEGRIRVKQMKTGKELYIPVHPRLAESIAACPSGQLAYLVTARGAPFVAASFGNWFRKACDKPGLKQCSAHGLRKAASRRMAELGLSNQLIKSITGHTSDSEVARYTRGADQVVMADQAMAAMVKGMSNQKPDDMSNHRESVGNE